MSEEKNKSKCNDTYIGLLSPDLPGSFNFYQRGEEVLRLDREGFYYKGEVIKDAGKAYNLFLEFITPSEPKGSLVSNNLTDST